MLPTVVSRIITAVGQPREPMREESRPAIGTRYAVRGRLVREDGRGIKTIRRADHRASADQRGAGGGLRLDGALVGSDARRSIFHVSPLERRRLGPAHAGPL